jgi:cytochrome c oxidase assembly protein Cox11
MFNTSKHMFLAIFCIILINAVIYSILTIPIYRIFCNVNMYDNTQLYFWEGELINSNIYTINICNAYQRMNETMHLAYIVIEDYICMHINLHMVRIAYPFIEHMCHQAIAVVTPYIQVEFVTKSTNVNLVEFNCLQNMVFVSTNETSLVFFRAYNRTTFDIIGMSTYIIYPNDLSIYIIKLECFCYDNIYLRSFETIDLPMLFYIDESIFFNSKANLTSYVVTIYYTWFNTKVVGYC